MLISSLFRGCRAGALASLLCLSPVLAGSGATAKTDFVFLIDGSQSMANEIVAVQAGLSGFVAGLNQNQVDARFAIVLYGGAPELVLDFTTVVADVQTAFGLIDVLGPVPGFQNNHNLNPEAALEAIRMTLGDSAETLDVTHVGGTGTLAFRPDARKNLILVTDEDSDLPFFDSNRSPGQVGLEPPPACPGLDANWQAEVDATAASVITHAAYVNLLVGQNDAPTRCQLGDPLSDVSDPDLLNFDPAATLANLVAAGYGDSLEGQVLASGLIGRAFDIGLVGTPNFIDNFFAAKVDENNPFFFCPGVACPCGNDSPTAVAGCANSTGQGALLDATGSPSVAADDLVLNATGLPAGQYGALLFGDASVACVPWGDGRLGVAPGPPSAFASFGVANTGAGGSLSAGPGLVSQAQSMSGATILAGTTWYFQAYYRDTNGGSPCGQRFNLSNALGVLFGN